MSGHLCGLASCFKEEEPALYVHCFADSLNLCLQDASQSCTAVCDSLELIMVHGLQNSQLHMAKMNENDATPQRNVIY